jgi:hypothetical protein
MPKVYWQAGLRLQKAKRFLHPIGRAENRTNVPARRRCIAEQANLERPRRPVCVISHIAFILLLATARDDNLGWEKNSTLVR